MFTHFLVENAIEHKIIHEYPSVEKDLKTVFESVDEHKILSVAAEFYNADFEELKEEFNVFFKTTFDFDYSKYSGCGTAWVWVMERMFGQTADASEIGKLIEKAEGLISDSVDLFLEYCIKTCRAEFEENFPTLKNKL